MKTQHEQLKQEIVTLISRNGLPVRTQHIVQHLVLPEQIILNDLLRELVAENRLSRSYTLLDNGEADYTYDLIS